MKTAILFSFFLLCNGEYPAALPDADVPGSPSDAYAAPHDISSPEKDAEQVPETDATPAPERTSPVTVPPAKSATFNFLTEYSAPGFGKFGFPEIDLKDSAVVNNDGNAAQNLQLSIPGLVPPVVPFPPVTMPVQIVPPSFFPPVQSSLPVSVPVQTIPVQPVQSIPVQPVQTIPVQPVQSIPVQPVRPIPIGTKTTVSIPPQIAEYSAPINQLPVQNLQSNFLPQQNYHNFLFAAAAPLNYASYSHLSNSFPSFAALFSQQQTLPETVSNVGTVPEAPTISTSSILTDPAVSNVNLPSVAQPSSSYGTPNKSN